MPRNGPATFTLRIPRRNIIERERDIVFSHPWRGADVYWIVPITYVVSVKAIGFDMYRLRISQAFFEVPTGPAGWQRDWLKHVG